MKYDNAWFIRRYRTDIPTALAAIRDGFAPLRRTNSGPMMLHAEEMGALVEATLPFSWSLDLATPSQLDTFLALEQRLSRLDYATLDTGYVCISRRMINILLGLADSLASE